MHESVLLEEVLDALSPRDNGVYVDGTLGGAGHSAALLTRQPGARLIGIDRDPTALAAARDRLAPFGDRATLVHAEYGEIKQVLADLGVSHVDGILLDLGYLYNFMDGSDGLAGGMACSGFLCYAIAAAFAGNTQFALLNLAIAAAAAGFLIHNFHPARIFLGDAGSVPLGFLAATLGLTGWQQCDWTWWFPLIVFAPFIVDASVTLARRLLSGARVWEAHRDHYYQRLVRLGGHRRTALLEYALMAGSGALALWAMTLRGAMQYGVLAAITAVYLVLLVLIERAWRRPGVAHD